MPDATTQRKIEQLEALFDRLVEKGVLEETDVENIRAIEHRQDRQNPGRGNQ